MLENTYVVIYASGQGNTNLWPSSRKQHPKIFLDLLGTGESLLQLTYQRCREICKQQQVLVLTQQDFVPFVHEQLPELGKDQILAEPIYRNTAPGLAYAAYKIKKRDPNASMVVMPADHLITNEMAFVRDVKEGLKIAKKRQNLLILGITPNLAEQNCGYIQYLPEENSPVQKIKTFTEKPQKELAQMFLESGDFVWNTGIYASEVSLLVQELEHQLPEMAETFEEGLKYYDTNEEAVYIKKAYSHTKNASLVHTVMEKAENARMMIGHFGWSRLNSWNALYNLRDKCPQGNAVAGEALLFESNNCLVQGREDKLIVVKGLQDYLVVDSDDVLLICPRESGEDLKNLSSDIKRSRGEHYL